MLDLTARRQATNERLQDLRHRLTDAESIIEGAACVYATGSFGRGEAGVDSDLDLFIISKLKSCNSESESKKQESQLKRLDEICVKAQLISATRKLNIPDFDGDGQYLSHYTVKNLKDKLGTPEDDVLNTFTARLLLLLESTPLIGGSVYTDIIRDIVDVYCQDYYDHKDEFLPAFLMNDILRLWRTLCVNYEARTQREPEEKNIKRRKKNYTLKHSRLLTCYSGVMFLLSKYRINKSVSPDDVMEMVSLSPTRRLERMIEFKELEDAHESIQLVLDGYENFLNEKSDQNRFDKMFSNDNFKETMHSSYRFADIVFDAVEKVGGNSRLYKLVVV